MARPTEAHIDLAALKHNADIAAQAAPNAELIAIIKADAYGHGALPCAEALAVQADAFGVACLEEALALRAGGIHHPILLLAGVFEVLEWRTVAEQGLHATIHSVHQWEWLKQAGVTVDRVYVKADTGMHRLGLAPEEVAGLVETIEASGLVKQTRLMSHFARADEVHISRTSEQMNSFEQILGDQDGCLANSAGTLAWPNSHHQGIRPGIMLYGADPLNQSNDLSRQLRAVMHLRSAISAVKDLGVGEPIGYGARYVTKKPTRMGVVPIGYADGYPRHAVDGTPVMVDGHASHIIGRVCMDMLMIDLSEVPNAQVGSEVELWGPNLAANTVAEHCQTIAYTLFTGVTARVPRIYHT